MNFLNKKLKTIFGAAGMVLLTGLFGISGTAVASGTPDGQTPANEGMCDSLQGSTPGLYGLCVAYCEAQDLDVTDKEPPRTKILENYNKKKQAGDPDMPCIQAPCPCWTNAELASVTTTGIAACIQGGTVDQPSLQLFGIAAATHMAYADTRRTRCGYIDNNIVPNVIRSQTISAGDAQICYDAIDAVCNP